MAWYGYVPNKVRVGYVDYEFSRICTAGWLFGAVCVSTAAGAAAADAVVHNNCCDAQHTFVCSEDV